MKTQTLLIAAAAALLLMPRRSAAAAPAGAPAVRQDYPNPIAVAEAAAGRVLAGLFSGFVNTPTKGATATNPKTEAARAAVRAGDGYYSSQWQMPEGTAAAGAGFFTPEVADLFYGPDN